MLLHDDSHNQTFCELDAISQVWQFTISDIPFDSPNHNTIYKIPQFINLTHFTKSDNSLNPTFHDILFDSPNHHTIHKIPQFIKFDTIHKVWQFIKSNISWHCTLFTMSDNAYNSTIILCRIISLLCAMIDFFVFFMQSLKRQELDSQWNSTYCIIC